MSGVTGLRTASRLPGWLGSVRLRLAILYSLITFALVAAAIGAVYTALARTLAEQQITDRMLVREVEGTACFEIGGFRICDADVETSVAEVERPLNQIEGQVNDRALREFRRLSLVSLAALLPLSIGIGWVLADWALRPIGRITRVAQDISATDLTRRIAMDGPRDEIRELADTFDDMLSRLDAAFEAQRQFIHEASHELRNPIAVIRTNADVALGDPDSESAELRDALEVVHRSAGRMGVLVDDLLTYARREAPTDRRTRVELGPLVDEAARVFAAAATARNLRIETIAPRGVTVDGDPATLGRALDNLVANAVRLAPPGSRIRIAAGERDQWRWLAVEDEGPGIAPDDQVMIFERFRRVGESASKDGRSGLGLAIVRQIARGHGGEVGLVSEPDIGSTFTVWLPAARRADMTSELPEPMVRAE